MDFSKRARDLRMFTSCVTAHLQGFHCNTGSCQSGERVPRGLEAAWSSFFPAPSGHNPEDRDLGGSEVRTPVPVPRRAAASRSFLIRVSEVQVVLKAEAQLCGAEGTRLHETKSGAASRERLLPGSPGKN